MSGAPVLEWRDLGGVWLADIGRFRAEVWEQGDGFPWSIGLRGRGDAIEAPFVREVRLCPETESLDAAKLAAEAACIDLLVSALACFPVECFARVDVAAPKTETSHGLMKVFDHRKDPFLSVDINDAIALGRALLVAGSAARAKETT